MTPPIKISAKQTNINKIKTKKLKIELENSKDLFSISSLEYCGTKAELKDPSANNLLNVLGSLKATKNASAIGPVPRNIAIKISLK
jgi:hypothetical protein